MHIAILVKDFPPHVIGGTETQTLQMARELQTKTDHEITVYTKSYPDDVSLETEFNVIRVPNWRISPFVSTLTFVLVVYLYLLRDARKYDLLQCMMIYPNGFVGYLTNLLTGIPYFAWIRGGDYYFMKDNPIKRWMMTRVFDDTRVLVQTEKIKREVHEEFPEADLEVLGNGVEIPCKQADGEYIVYLGRLREQKGVDRLLRAVDGLDEDLLIIGDGPTRDALESIARSLDISVEFAGEVPPEDVFKHLRRGKLFVLPSIEGEGLPNAVLEAMAIGLPVITTDQSGLPDVVEDGETGFVVPTDDVPALRKRIKEITEDEKKRKEMGNNARQFIRENYSWSQIIARLKTIYSMIATQ